MEEARGKPQTYHGVPTSNISPSGWSSSMRLLQTVGLFTLPCDKVKNSGAHEGEKCTWQPRGFHVGGRASAPAVNCSGARVSKLSSETRRSRWLLSSVLALTYILIGSSYAFSWLGREWGCHPAFCVGIPNAQGARASCPFL